MVPSSLPSIALILRVANEIQDDNPRVAHLCRVYALKEADRMDPASSGRGVRQLKTYLSTKIEEEKDEIKCQLARTDERETQLYYQIFYEKNIKEGQDTKQPEEMAKFYQIAMVLRDVLKTVLPSSQVDYKTVKYVKELESRKEQYEHYNILPLYAVGIKPPIMKLPEITVPFQAICNVENLPMPIAHSGSDVNLYVNDIFDWLLSLYGFQMASDVFETLSCKVHPVSDANQTAVPDHEYFLRTVITPIYKVLLKEARKNKEGRASHSTWSNYDDLNEFFWSENCFMLRWRREGEKYYFQHLDEIPLPNEAARFCTYIEVFTECGYSS
ncbi:hypothetical protein GOBAR_DD09687 [Gossypium barbadense]|nr:hypothetical protein GOBAR_DD09687 [Gossypium barbadense]